MRSILFRVVMTDVDKIRKKNEVLASVMDERMTRLWAPADAEALGWGGVAAVTEATGILGKRIAAGKRDLTELRANSPTDSPQDQHVRREGAGRKQLEVRAPELIDALSRWTPRKRNCSETSRTGV